MVNGTGCDLAVGTLVAVGRDIEPIWA